MAFRQGDWVLVSNTSDSQRPKTHALSKEDLPFIKSATLTDFQLFNLKTDLDQSANVIGENVERFETMRARMIEVHREIVDEGEGQDAHRHGVPRPSP